MKKRLIAAATLLAVLSSSVTVFAASSSHSFESTGMLWWKTKKESVSVSGVLVGEHGTIGAEVWDSTYNLDSEVKNYQRDKTTQATSISVSASDSDATRGYYLILHYDYVGNVAIGQYGWDY